MFYGVCWFSVCFWSKNNFSTKRRHENELCGFVTKEILCVFVRFSNKWNEKKVFLKENFISFRSCWRKIIFFFFYFFNSSINLDFMCMGSFYFYVCHFSEICFGTNFKFFEMTLIMSLCVIKKFIRKRKFITSA